MSQTTFLIPLNKAHQYPASLVGELGQMKGKLAEAKLPIPQGFVITSQTFYHLLTPQLSHQLESALALLDPQEPSSIKQAAAQFQRFLMRMTISEEVTLEITKKYHQLGEHSACRLHASFTHQSPQRAPHYTQGDVNLMVDIRKCWADLFGPEILTHMVQHKESFDAYKPTIVLEHFSPPKVSGLLSTQNPRNGNKSSLMIEAVWGIREYLDTHPSEADTYEIEKNTWDVIHTEYQDQKKALVFSKGKTTLESVPSSRKDDKKLTDNLLLKLSQVAKKIQKEFFFPQECDWEIDRENNVTITNLRPLRESALSQVLTHPSSRPLVYGVSGASGHFTGKVKIVKNWPTKESLSPNDILVVKSMRPTDIAHLPQLGALICDAPLLPRDIARLHIPCVMNAKVATSVLHSGQVVTVLGEYGAVFEGDVAGSPPAISKSSAAKSFNVWYAIDHPHHFSPEIISQVSGIGPIRGRDIVQLLDVHPQVLQQRNKSHLLEEALHQTLETLISASEQKPVLYELIDMTTAQYHRLSGGEILEPPEQNPFLGYHGAYRLLADRDLFELQLRVIRNLSQPIQVIIPFVRTIEEWVVIKKVLHQYDLDKKAWVGMSTPSSLFNFASFVQHGAFGGIINEKDLFSLFTGSQTDQPHDFSPTIESNEGYFKLIHVIAETANRMKTPLIYSSFSGSANMERVQKNGIRDFCLRRNQIESLNQRG